MATVALHIIAKKNEDDIKRIVTTYGQYFDDIDVAVDEEIEKIDGINVYKYDWDEEEKKRGYPSFDKKRNWLVSKCKCDYYLRLDTDDIIEKPELVKDIVEKMVSTGVDVIACFYNYSRDEYGNCHAGHYRETFVRNNGKYKWNKKIHENVIPVDGGKPKTAIDKDFTIFHDIDSDHAKKSEQRNIKFLIEEYEATKDNPDPRTLAYLGRMFYPMGKLTEARFFLEKHIAMSGWDEDRYMSLVMLADVYNDLGKFDIALSCCHRALSERPDFPEAYLKLHDLYFQKQEWDKAIHWGKLGLSIQRPDSFTLIDPSLYTWRPAISMSLCYQMIGEADTAQKFFRIAEKAAPGLEWITKNKKVFDDAVLYKRYIDQFLWVLNFLKERDHKKIPQLFQSIPEELKSHEILVRLSHQYLPPKKWGSDEVVIYCGQAWEEWSAPSVLKGIGGSEEAVIYLAQELNKLGWKVTVFNSCGEMAGTYSGVTYRQYQEFNPFDDYNVVIAWRTSIFGTGTLKAKRKIIWLHDVPFKELLPKAEVNTYDKVVVLSKYHKSLLPDYIPEEKIYVSRNGINQRDFTTKDKTERNPKRIIYTSSYDRGIIHLLQEWGNIRKEVPDAELHLFYGWNTYLEMMKKGARPKDFYLQMSEFMKQPGVTEHGRVGHKQLIKELFKSGIYAYPSHFEEISCISAMKAQACGCVPVVINYAALKETVRAGIKIDGKGGESDTNYRFRDEIIAILKDTERQEELRKEVQKYQNSFSWEAVAKDWTKNLLQVKRNEYKDYEDYKKTYVTHGDFKRTNFDAQGNLIVWDRYQLVLNALQEVKAKSFLDVGASDGGLCFLVNEKIGIRADGIEADAKCVEFANKHAYENKYQSVFLNGLAEEVNPPQKYDVVSALEIIEHVIDPKKFLDRLESFANKGGYVIISTPDKDGYFGEKNFNPQHIHFFDTESLIKLIGKERVVKVDTRYELVTVMYKV